MGLSFYNLKRWAQMLAGKSVYHVNQGLGKAIDKGGYYNDLTQKVLMGDSYLDETGIPVHEHLDGSHIHMPTIIFQYGLGAYDLYLLEKNENYLSKAIQCADWAIDNQNENGSWSTFFYVYPDNPYSAMPQGEAASLLLRIYQETNEQKYLKSAQDAIDFMLKGLKDGGVSSASGSALYLHEYTHLPIVLNGWIFASWGIYDLSIIFPEYKEVFERTVQTILNELPKYDNGYWSLYDASGMMTSPFYHNLHIAQMEAMYQITGEEKFKEYEQRFKKYNSNAINKARAFVVKAIQKLKEH